MVDNNYFYFEGDQFDNDCCCGCMYRYVLLKERNMLLTLKHEANRQGYIMPAPERLKKVCRVKRELPEQVQTLSCILAVGAKINGQDQSCYWGEGVFVR